jgi:SAM-dependent methyltransferase
LAAAEAAVVGGWTMRPHRLAGLSCLGFEAAAVDPAALSRLSAGLALFEAVPDPAAPDQTVPDLSNPDQALPDPADLDQVLLRPLPWPALGPVEEDLVTIPKYAGKTNEQFTQLLLNVTLSQVRAAGPVTVLDPMCGRGTTLTTAWRLGWDAAGVEVESSAVEALAAFLKTYLRRKRLKHRAELNPVRRDGRNLGKRLEVEAQFGDQTRHLAVFSGDTRQSAVLWGKRRFQAVVVDAPYGVVHGSRSGPGSGRQRSAGQLLAEAVPVWSRQLAPGGALGLSWNSLGLPRADLIELVQQAGLTACQGGPWELFGHRVDSSIYRDIVVATKPLELT